MKNLNLNFISPVAQIVMSYPAYSSFDTAQPIGFSIYWVNWGFDSEVWAWINGPTFGPPRRIQEAGGEQSGSSTIYQPGRPWWWWWGGRVMQSMAEGWNMGSFCRAGGKLRCYCCCRLSFTSIKRTVSLHLFQFSVILWRQSLFLVFWWTAEKQTRCPEDGCWLVDQGLQRARPCGLSCTSFSAVDLIWRIKSGLMELL